MIRRKVSTHFKISLIANLKILEDEQEEENHEDAHDTLRRMNFYARYAMEPHSRYTNWDTQKRIAEIRKHLKDETKERAFKNFSLDRYMREHVYMVSDNSPTVDVTITFDKDFLETVLTQLTLKQIVEPLERDEKKLQTIMTVQDNDGLYQWLMRYSDKVTVLAPQKVRDELRKRLHTALTKLKR